MKKENKMRRLQSLGIMFNLVLALFAFCFILNFGVGGVTSGSALTPTETLAAVSKIAPEKNSVTGGLDYFLNGNKIANAIPQADGNSWILYDAQGTKIYTSKLSSDGNLIIKDMSGKPVLSNLVSPNTGVIDKAIEAPKEILQIGRNFDKIPFNGEQIQLINKGTFEGTTYMQAADGRIFSQTGTEAIKQIDKLPEFTGKALQFAPQQEYGSWLSKNVLPLGQQGLWTDALVSGAQWAGVAFMAGYSIGSIAGLENSQRLALSWGMAAGFGTYKFLATWTTSKAALGTGLLSGGALIGLGAGLVVTELLWKSEKKEVITISCDSWEAPTRGTNCEKCNSDIHTCSEYRCKSLGQACELLNAGTAEERCAWVNPRDVKSPVITLDNNVLTKDYKYNPMTAANPGDIGFKIVAKSGTNACIKAFTPLAFGIKTDEPAQCKIDYNRTMNFDAMKYYFDNSQNYRYSHNQTLSLPSPSNLNKESPEIKNDGNYNLYIRCRDKNGNYNTGMFVLNFCVDKEADVTAPIIKSSSIANNMPIQFGLNETPIEIYTNEPADCKWSREDMSYDNMENNMSCSQNIWEMNSQLLYKCKGKLTGLQSRAGNNFYFRCSDQPLLGNNNDRNKNTESYKLTLKGTEKLTIDSVQPEGIIKSSSGNYAQVYLQVETGNGENNGDAICSYSLTKETKDFTKFFETGTNLHKQLLNLVAGSYNYNINCIDLGGNSAESVISFSVEIDNGIPQVIRAYKDGSRLKITTDKKTTCSFQTNDEKACNFKIAEGTNMPYTNSTEHNADIKEGKNYYIRCADQNLNMPDPAKCSIIIRG